MKEPTRRIRWTEAYKLMEARDESGRQKPFDIRFACMDGTIVEAEGVQRSVSYNRRTGMRRLVLAGGGFRNVYDVLILQINDYHVKVVNAADIEVDIFENGPKASENQHTQHKHEN